MGLRLKSQHKLPDIRHVASVLQLGGLLGGLESGLSKSGHDEEVPLTKPPKRVQRTLLLLMALIVPF